MVCFCSTRGAVEQWQALWGFAVFFSFSQRHDWHLFHCTEMYILLIFSFTLVIPSMRNYKPWDRSKLHTSSVYLKIPFLKKKKNELRKLPTKPPPNQNGAASFPEETLLERLLLVSDSDWNPLWCVWTSTHRLTMSCSISWMSFDPGTCESGRPLVHFCASRFWLVGVSERCRHKTSAWLIAVLRKVVASAVVFFRTEEQVASCAVC